MNVNTAVRNMSNETLTRITPKVERLFENRNADGSLNLQTKEDEVTLHKLINEAHQHLPRPCKIQFAQARSAARQQAIANGTIFQGNGLSPGFALHEDGTFTIFNSVQEREESANQWTQNLLERMMEAINAMEATDSQKSQNGGGIVAGFDAGRGWSTSYTQAESARQKIISDVYHDEWVLARYGRVIDRSNDNATINGRSIIDRRA